MREQGPTRHARSEDTQHVAIFFPALAGSRHRLLLSAGPSWAEPVSSLAVEVRTANAVYGGTDNDVHLVLLVQSGSDPPVERRWNLDSGIDDFERGNQDTYTLTTDLPADTCNIIGISIQKSPDDFDGGWKLDWFRVIINGNQFYRGNVDAWLEDDHREWWGADFTPTACGGGFYFGPSAGTRPPMPNCTGVSARNHAADQARRGLRQDPGRQRSGIRSRRHGWRQHAGPHRGLERQWRGGSGRDRSERTQQAIGPAGRRQRRHREYLRRPRSRRHPRLRRDGSGNPDTDGDGWFDGPRNVRTRLFLVQVHCKDSSEDTELGDDEVFVTFNHARWPHDSDLDGYWEMGDDDQVSPMIEAARRTRGISAVGPLRVRIDLREDDWFDWTDDDFELDHDHFFPEAGLSQWTYKDDGWFNDVEYELKFVSVTQLFGDPTPESGEGDKDNDGITEVSESALANSMMGVADPQLREIYMELDVMGEGQMPETYTREDIVSRFTEHGYAFHLDDGAFGGGEILPYDEIMSIADVRAQRAMNLAAVRLNTFHYAVGVDVVEEPGENRWNGRGERVKFTNFGGWLVGDGDVLVWKTDFLDHLSDFESIVWLHEFGHNVGLCHRQEDTEAQALGPSGAGICDGTNSGTDCHCGHYAVSSSSDTAMGNAKGFLYIEALDREIDFDAEEWTRSTLRRSAGRNR